VSEPILAIVGPTASGKTALGLHVAEALDTEIVSVDSMLVYRGMDVGTAKPTAEDQARVRHHLIDVAEPSEPYSVARFQAEALEAVGRIEGAGHRTLLVGGSGLYFRAVVDELDFPGTDPGTRGDLERQAEVLGSALMYQRLASLDPVAAERIEPGNVRRIVRALEVAAVTGRPFSTFAEAWERYPADRVRVAGLAVPRDVLLERIRARVEAMLDTGWLEEVRGLIETGFGEWLTASQAIGYAELARHLQGTMSLGAATEATVKRTGALARRQVAWFRRDPRIRWFDVGAEGGIEASDAILAYLRDARVAA
jgi:tRNA dimethylallyltransferase